MAFTINGIVAQELVADYDEEAGDGLASTKKYLVDWDQRYAFANAMLSIGTGSSFAGQAISAPQPHPESPNIFAKRIHLRGVDAPRPGAKQLRFNYAICSVSYGVLPYGQPGGDGAYVYPQLSFDPASPLLYASQHLRFASQTQTIRGRKVQWLEGPNAGKRLDFDFSFQYTVIHCSLTLHHLTWLPLAAAEAAGAAPLNSDTFLGRSQGKVRFEGIDTEDESYTDGTRALRATMGFTIRPVAAWDLKSENGKDWYRVGSLAGDDLVGYSDLNQLIAPCYRG